MSIENNISLLAQTATFLRRMGTPSFILTSADRVRAQGFGADLQGVVNDLTQNVKLQQFHQLAEELNISLVGVPAATPVTIAPDTNLVSVLSGGKIPADTFVEFSDFDSSNVEAVFYNSARELLRVKFNSGAIYDYDGVSESVVLNLVNAGSVGGYFNREIKGAYPCSKRDDLRD